MNEAFYKEFRQDQLEFQYNPRLSVPEYPELAKKRVAASRQVRSTLKCWLDVPYGRSPRETLDIYPAAHSGGPVLVYYHGGYWRGGQQVWTTFHLFQAFAPKLASSGWGRVIAVSKSTINNPSGKEGAYAAAKAAQENLVLTLAAELKDNNVTANIIQVKAIDVDATSKGTDTTPDVIIAAIQYLFSEQGGKVNGARIPLY